LPTRQLFTFLLHKVAHLLSRVYIYESPVSALYHVTLIGNAQAVLPVIRVGIRELVVFAGRLIRYVEHAREMRNHLVLLEADRHHLRVVRVQLCGHLEGRLT
jgi:hypothetical protein